MNFQPRFGEAFLYRRIEELMKFGMRTPSLKRSLKARTTSKWKRQAKKAVIPGYGRKGMGWMKNPRKALYNKVYRKTSFSFWDLFK
jgi:hypothetical protein